MEYYPPFTPSAAVIRYPPACRPLFTNIVGLLLAVRPWIRQPAATLYDHLWFQPPRGGLVVVGTRTSLRNNIFHGSLPSLSLIANPVLLIDYYFLIIRVVVIGSARLVGVPESRESPSQRPCILSTYTERGIEGIFRLEWKMDR